jgi:hypothetical protein
MEYGEAPKPGAAETSEPAPYQQSLRIQSVAGGVPIAAVYAGYKTTYNFKPAAAARRMAFAEAAAHYRYFEAATAIHNPYVPPRRSPKGGIDRQRRLTGNGEIFTDPLDAFKPQRFKSTKLNDPSRLTYKSGGPSRWEKKGLSAYRAANRDNVDGVDE